MLQSILDTEIGKAEFKLLRDQKHVDYVWTVMDPIVDENIERYLDGITYSNHLLKPQDSFTFFLQKLIGDNDKLHDKYHDIFSMDAMEEYGEDTEGFKSAVLKKECDVIRKTLSSKTEALKEWKAKFYACKSQELYDTFYNLISFGADYNEDMDEDAMIALDAVEDCRLAEMEEDAAIKPVSLDMELLLTF